jgi:hypothetical protein
VKLRTQIFRTKITRIYEIYKTLRLRTQRFEIFHAKITFYLILLKNVAKLIIKIAIYPSNEELSGCVEKYLKSNHPEFYDNFSEIKWTAFYNKNLQKSVSRFFYFKIFFFDTR